MRIRSSLVAIALFLSGCGTLNLPGVTTPAAQTTAVSSAADAQSLGGLTNDVAAHPSVQLAKPLAFVLTAQARPFLAALEAKVVPMRQTLAERLAADATVSTGLSGWDRAATDAKMATLTRVAQIEAEVMGCAVPAIAKKVPTAADTGLMAYYQPAAFGAGTITLYTTTLAQKSKYVAVAVMVHEMRHAAQYQLFTASNSQDADTATLADAYEAAWSATEDLGGQSQLAYGDYVHLNVEYDAFQTGNQVAALLAEAANQTPGLGFVDMQYDASATPVYDLLAQTDVAAGQALIAAVNRAQYNAQRATGGTFTPQRPGGNVSLPTDWRNRTGRTRTNLMPTSEPIFNQPIFSAPGGRRGR